MRFYGADAVVNGLKYPRHQEETAVTTFVRSIRTAVEGYQKDPLCSPLIPNWNRVESALPTFLDELRDAVREDNDLAEVSVPGAGPMLGDMGTQVRLIKPGTRSQKVVWVPGSADSPPPI